MQHNDSPSGRLVQIEPLKKNTPDSTLDLRIPTLTESVIFRKKAYVGFRKIIGFLYTKHSWGAVRRWLLPKVLPDKVLYRWKPYQRGGCNRCGLCCKIVFRCPFFHEDVQTTACTIYTSEKHSPDGCVVFPIDPRDLAEVQREVAPAPCPFYYEGQPEHPTTWGALKAEIRAELGRRVNKLKEEFNN